MICKNHHYDEYKKIFCPQSLAFNAMIDDAKKWDELMRRTGERK